MFHVNRLIIAEILCWGKIEVVLGKISKKQILLTILLMVDVL